MNEILVVDDDLDFTFNLSAILRENGFAVIAAASGREALLYLLFYCQIKFLKRG
ncbi:MAG: hypothetical protein L6428_10825 [Candidatus Aminicenantes bacterium]|nr:hypothetical protein [Candidatus Aminicenantes bacterium]